MKLQRTLALLPAIVLALSAPPARAVLIDDFSGLNVGAQLHGQNLWSTHTNTVTGTGNVTVQAPGGNEAARYQQTSGGQQRGLFKSLRNATVFNNDVATLYLEFTPNGMNLDSMFGLSDNATPLDYDHFEAQVVIRELSGNLTVRARDGSSFVDLSTVDVGTTYSIWMVADNSTNLMDVYIQGGAFAGQTQIGSGLAFRNGNNNPLRTFYGRTGTNIISPSSMDLDNIYVRPGVDLSNPTVLPAGVLATYALVSGTDYSSPATLVADGLSAAPMTTDPGNWGNTNVGFHTLHTISDFTPEGAGGNTAGLPNGFDSDAYYSLTLTPDGDPIQVTGLEFTQIAGKSGNTGGHNSTIFIRSSLDNFADDLGSFTIVFPNDGDFNTFVSELRFLDLTGDAAFGSIADPLEFRFYLTSGSSAPGKIAGFTDLTIFGSIVPEPSTYALGLLGALGVTVLVWRRGM